MATFTSPSETPAPLTRFSSRTRRNSISPIQRSYRLVARASTRLSSPSTNDQQNTLMDVDEIESVETEGSITRTYGETIFAKSGELIASFYASLPVEVKQVLRSADFFKDAYSGTVDTVTGFALVVSIQTCFVWQHAQAVRGTPTCYIFSCPQDDIVTNPPLHAFIPQSTSREPGLILVSFHGQVRFWESISIGLAGGENFTTMDLDLTEDEHVTNFVRADAKTFIVATSSGHLLRLTLTPTGGKYHLISRLFSRPVPSLSLSRLIPSFFGSSNLSPVAVMDAHVSSIALGKPSVTGECIVWTLVGERIQKWELKPEGWEDLLSDRSILVFLRSAVRDAFGIMEDRDESMDFELIDLGCESEDKLVVLVSYIPTEEVALMETDASEARRVFALVRLSAYGDTFMVENIKTVPYQSAATSGTHAYHPRIQFLACGAIVIVRFDDAVALIARDSDYRDRLELKSGADRILGVGAYETDGTLLISTASTMMRIVVDREKINAFDYQTGHTSIVKLIMMQAIVYGTLTENPLQFSFPPEVDAESLMQAAEQLSSAVLRSAPEVVPKNHDLISQLNSRKERLSWLIQFINDNAVLGKISQTTRQKLATDAEKMYAALQLWLQYNDLLATNPQFSVLNDAIHELMSKIQEGPYEDVLRAFFRLRTADIGRLIKKVKDAAKSAARNTGHDIAQFLLEANRIVITILHSAFEYRIHNVGTYGLEMPMINPWTSRPSVIDAVLVLFNASTEASEVQGLTRGTQLRLGEPHTQLPELAEILFACIQERLNWLGGGSGANESSAKRDKEELEQKFSLLRSEVLETLRRCGYENAAFALGEQYRDFSSLVALCNSETVYPPDQNPNAERIQTYIDRYQEEFTRELYQWHIQRGELRVMFSQEDEKGYLDNFFAEKPNPAISWLNDIGKGRFDSASKALYREAQGAQNLEVKHVMLSLGKLTYMAQIYDKGSSPSERRLGRFHDELDLISVHEVLSEDLKSALTGVRGRRSLESQVDIIVTRKAAKLVERGGILYMFKEFVRQLLQGKVLPIEDIADVLTLKDNEEAVEDYAIALQLITRAANLSEARKKSALRTVWRRVYLHDDWNAVRRTANLSDAELNERFKWTTLYRVYSAQLSRSKSEDFEIKPDEALEIPSSEEIALRWPGISPEHLDAIMNDYTQEMDALGELELDEELVLRIKELAVQNAA